MAEKGKSHEVLRNKIIACDLELLTHRMKEVLGTDFTFRTPPRTERERAEYINLLVEQNGKRLDVGLQDSGFLQVAEIFSSIAIMDNALNILLIDGEASEKVQYAMLKDNIKKFVLDLEGRLGQRLIERDDDESETISSKMLNTYLETAETLDDIFENYLCLFSKIKSFIE